MVATKIFAKRLTSGAEEVGQERFDEFSFGNVNSPIYFKKIVGHALFSASNTAVATAVRNRLGDIAFDDNVTSEDVAIILKRIGGFSQATLHSFPNSAICGALKDVVADGDGVALFADFLVQVFDSFISVTRFENFTVFDDALNFGSAGSRPIWFKNALNKLPEAFSVALEGWSFWLRPTQIDENGIEGGITHSRSDQLAEEVELSPFLPMRGFLEEWDFDSLYSGKPAVDDVAAFAAFHYEITGKEARAGADNFISFGLDEERKLFFGYFSNFSALFFAEVGHVDKVSGVRQGYALRIGADEEPIPVTLTKFFEFKLGRPRSQYSVENRADRIEIDHYRWSGPVWFGLICGLRYERNFSRWNLSGESSDFFETPYPDINDGLPETLSLVYQKHNSQVFIAGRSRGYSPRISPNCTAPRTVRTAYAQLQKFPEARKKNKGTAVFSDDASKLIWEAPQRQKIGKRKQQQAAMTALELAGKAARIVEQEVRYNATNAAKAAVKDNEFYRKHHDFWRVDGDANDWHLANLPPAQEWCHLVGHKDGGSGDEGNLVAASYSANTLQLAIETGIRFFNDLHERLHLLVTAYLMPAPAAYIVDGAEDRLRKVNPYGSVEGRIAEVKDWINKKSLRYPADNLLGEFKSSEIDFYEPFTNELDKFCNHLLNGAKMTEEDIRELLKTISNVVGDLKLFGPGISSGDELYSEMISSPRNDNFADRVSVFKRVVLTKFDTFLQVILFQHPVAVFVRYAVMIKSDSQVKENKKGGKIFDFIFDAQCETFGRNEFRILSERIKRAVLYAFEGQSG